MAAGRRAVLAIVALAACPTSSAAPAVLDARTAAAGAAGERAPTGATAPLALPGACDGIAATERFDARIGLRWTHVATNVQNRRIIGDHAADLQSVLRRVAVGDEVVWEGAPGGTAALNDTDSDLAAQPVTTVRMRGAGAIATLAAGVPLVGTRLVVDLASCRYRLESVPWVRVATTGPDGRTESVTLPLGAIRTGWTPLGAWPGAGLYESDVSLPAHGIASARDVAHAAEYLPFGLAQLVFAGDDVPHETPAGEAVVSWAITSGAR